MTTNPRLSGLLALTLVAGCANVIGTSDYEPCEAESCPAGGAGAGGAAGGAGGSGPSCFNVTMNVSGSVKVHIETPDVDFDSESPGPICLPAGSITANAECDQGGGDDPPVVVSWGNDLCSVDAASCTFTLLDPETFTVSAPSCQ